MLRLGLKSIRIEIALELFLPLYESRDQLPEQNSHYKESIDMVSFLHEQIQFESLHYLGMFFAHFLEILFAVPIVDAFLRSGTLFHIFAIILVAKLGYPGTGVRIS